MGKSIRKYRRSRNYDYLSEDGANSYTIPQGQGTNHVENGQLILEAPLSPNSTLRLIKDGESSSCGVFMNFSATCVGGSAIVMPYVFYQAGFIPAIALLLVIGLVTFHTNEVLTDLGIKNERLTYHGIAKLAYGSLGFFLVCILQLLSSLGITTAYMLVSLEEAPVLLGSVLGKDFFLTDHTLFAIFYTFGALVPLSLIVCTYKRAEYFATLSNFFMIFGTLCVLIKSSQKHQHNLSTRDVTKVYVFPGKQLFQAVGTLCAAFAAQHHLFYGLHVLRDRTWSGFQRITIGAVFFSFTLALILVCFATSFCIPLEIICSRRTILLMFGPEDPTGTYGETDVLFQAQAPKGEQVKAQVFTWKSHVCTTLIFLGLGLTFSFFSTKIATVFNIAGIAGVLLSFVFPAAIQLKLTQGQDLPFFYGKFMPHFALITGFIGFLAISVSNILDTVDNNSKP